MSNAIELEKLTNTKMESILEKFIIYLKDNFNTEQETPNKVRINKKLMILIRDDGVVFDVNTLNAIGIWDNILQEVNTNNFVLPPIEYIEFDAKYVENALLFLRERDEYKDAYTYFTPFNISNAD